MKLFYPLKAIRRFPMVALVIILTVLLPKHSICQGIEAENIIKSRLINCSDVAYTTTTLLQEYHQKQEIDTLQALMYYWESNCGLQEPLMRFLALHLIETNTFYEDWYPQNLLTLLTDYRDGQKKTGFRNLYYDYTAWEYYPINPNFNDFTISLATNLKRYEDLKPVERYFLEFYSNNFREADRILKSGALAGSGLDSLLKSIEVERLAGPMHFFSFSAGIWGATGKLHEALGARPEVGLALEFQQMGFFIDGYFNVAFGGTSTPYTVRVNNQNYQTKTFLGIVIGGDIGVDVLSPGNTSLIPMVGIGYRGFESLNLDENDTSLPTNFIGSVNGSVGLYLRNRYSPTGHVGLQARYNFVNFKNEGGTDLSGNIFTMGLVFGIYY
jgi:hypothetical protein